MKTMAEIVQERKAQKLSQKNQDKLVKDLSGNFDRSNHNLATNIPKPELSINFNGMEHINVNSLTVEGLIPVLEAFFREVIGQVDQLKQDIKGIEFSMPEIKMPDINVPQPKVTVNIPPPEAPKKETPKSKLTDVKSFYTPQGELKKIVETYQDGTKKTATGFDTNDIKISYD